MLDQTIVHVAIIVGPIIHLTHAVFLDVTFRGFLNQRRRSRNRVVSNVSSVEVPQRVRGSHTHLLNANVISARFSSRGLKSQLLVQLTVAIFHLVIIVVDGFVHK